jgi:hypothetical protein
MLVKASYTGETVYRIFGGAVYTKEQFSHWPMQWECPTISRAEWGTTQNAAVGAAPCSQTKGFKKCALCAGARCSPKWYDLMISLWGIPICSHCINNVLQRCFNCDTIVRNIAAPFNGRETIVAGMKKLCRECYTTLFAQCPQCLELVAKETINEEGCQACLKTVIKDYNFHPDPRFLHPKGQQPASSLPYMGLELEVEMKERYTDKKEVVARRFHKAAQGSVYLKHDSSIFCGFEIVSHPGTFEWWSDPDNPALAAIKKLTKTCQSFWCENTGIHVHISRDKFVNNWHRALFVHFITLNKEFSSFVAERYQGNTAAFKFELDQNLATLIQGAGKMERHAAVNLSSSQPTIEVRIFKGNLRTDRILKDIEYIQAVFEYTHRLAINKNPGIRAFTMDNVNELNEHLEPQIFKKWLKGNHEKRFPNLVQYIAKYKGDS